MNKSTGKWRGIKHHNISGLVSSLVMLLLLSGLLIIPVCGLTLNWTTTNITTATTDSDQECPAIWEDRIVWQDRMEYNYEIMLYNSTSGEERRLTFGGSDEIHPDIFENLVVWMDYIDWNYDIVLFNLASNETIRITNESHDQIEPSVWGDTIAWVDQRGDVQAVFCYDLETGEEMQVSEDGASSSKPDIWGNYIVWEQWFGDNSEIMLYNISNGTRQRITSDPENQQDPVIWEKRIVWTEYRDGYRQLSLFNITTGIETNLTSDPWNHAFPVIFGDIIVYENDKFYYDVSLIDIGTGEEILLTPDTPDTSDTEPEIWENRIVWRDGREWYYDIYLCTLGVSKPPLTADFRANITEGMPPFAVEFTDISTGDISSWWWDFGDGTESREQNPVHTYTDPEIYSVILTIHNPWQRSAVEKEGLITAGMAPRPDFTADVYSGPAPLGVQFQDTSAGYPDSWLWEFGDGTTDEDQNPFHEYDTPGSYTVMLTVENKWGNGTIEKESCIVVKDADTHEVILPDEGVTLDDQNGIHLVLNCSIFNATVFDPLVNRSVVTCIPDPGFGIAALQFLTDDPGGFFETGNKTIEGNLSGITVTSLDFRSENRNISQGLVWTYNYSAFFPQYPQYGKITSLLWEGSTPEDTVLFEGIAMDNHHHVKDTAYTILFQKENIWSAGPATLTFAVDSEWIEAYGWRPCLQLEGNVEQCMVFVDSQYLGDTPLCLSGRLSPGNHTLMLSKYGFENNISNITLEDKKDYIRVIRVSDWGEGSLLEARFIYHDPLTNLDYFEAYSPEGFSKFGIVSVWQEGNVFQIIQLAAAEVIRPGSGSSGGGGGGGSGGHRVSENTAALATTNIPTPVPTPAGTPPESLESTGPVLSTSPVVTMESGEPVPQVTGAEQGASFPGSLAEGTSTLILLKNLSVIFVVIFITIVFYLRWVKRDE